MTLDSTEVKNTAFVPGGSVRIVPGQNPGLRTGRGTNTYLLGRKQFVLIDAGAGIPAYDPLLKQAVHGLSGQVSLILITHGHQDHAGGIEAVRKSFPGVVVRKFPAPGDPLDVRPIVADEPIHFEGGTLKALHTPGHAADHLCFYWVEERALFSGDLILGEGTTVIPRRGGSLRDYLKSLELIRALDIRVIYPGHGPLIEDPRAKITENIEHRLARERQILEAMRAGAHTTQELVARVYAGVPGALHGLASESVWNHLVKLEEDGCVRRRQEGDRAYYEVVD